MLSVSPFRHVRALCRWEGEGIDEVGKDQDGRTLRVVVFIDLSRVAYRVRVCPYVLEPCKVSLVPLSHFEGVRVLWET